MSHKKWALLMLFVLLSSLILTACEGETKVETVIQEKTIVQEKTVVEKETVVQEGETVVQEKTVVEEKTVVVTATPEPEEVEPKTLVVCMGQEPDTLYIYGGAMTAAAHVQHAIYDGPIDSNTFGYQPVIFDKLPSLSDGDAIISTVMVAAGDTIIDSSGEPVQLEEGLTVRPAGCRSTECEVTYEGGEFEMDQMVVNFKIKEGILWSDGEPLKASDSVYSFELYMDPDTPNPTRYAGERTASYEAMDDQTVVWTGLPGYIDSIYFTNFWQPLPEHILGNMTAAEIVESEEASRTPIGWGAYIISEWVAGDHISVVKNPNYFRADEGLPYLDEVVFRFVGEEPNPAIAAMLAGDCDIISQDISLEDQAELLIQLEAQGELIPTFVTGTSWEHVDFGINPVESYDRPDFFEDVRTRQAIAMCLDTQAVIDAVLYGRSVKINSYIPPEHPMYNPDAKFWDYDPEAAKALLEEVGWIDTDGDGIREAQGVEGIPDGTKLAFSWMSTTAGMRVAYMQIYQQNLIDCGIDLSLDNRPATEYFASGPEGPLFGRHFDIGSFTFGTGVQPPCNLYLSSQIPSEENGWAGQNDPGFIDPEFDEVCNAALQSLPGTPEYEQYHKEAQRIFAEKVPVVPLFLRLKLAAYIPEVSGFIVDPTENSEMWNIEAFDIDK